MLIWLLVCAIAIPLSTVTRFFDLTGMDVDVFGLTLHLTIYLPKLLCIPLVIWYGFFWAAVPAYLASFTVALLGGMPLQWVMIFALSNPVGLAIYALFYRVSPLQTNMRDMTSVVGFVLISLAASLASSAGSFIWTYTNQIGIHDAYVVWQGWWLGEWLHCLLIIMPMLFLFNDKVTVWLAPVKAEEPIQKVTRSRLFMAVLAFMTVLISYVLTAKTLGMSQAKQVLTSLDDTQTVDMLTTAIDSMAYPLYILLVVMLAMAFLSYQAILYWNHALRLANDKLSAQNDELETLVNIDFLTGVLNRRKVMESFDLESTRALRTGEPLSIMMLDVDYFKQINDQYGHIIGDEVLVTIASKIKSNLRPYDHAGRYGGEEFLLIFPNTELDEAATIGERIRQSVKNAVVATSDTNIHVTVSIGISNLTRGDEESNQSLSRADQALYKAKNAGRDRVIW